MANQPAQAGVDPRLVQQVIQDASMMEQEGQTRVMISRQLFQQLQAALQTYYGNAKQVDKMFEIEQNLVYLSAKLEDQIVEFARNPLGALMGKERAVIKKARGVSATIKGKRLGNSYTKVMKPGKGRRKIRVKTQNYKYTRPHIRAVSRKYLSDKLEDQIEFGSGGIARQNG